MEPKFSMLVIFTIAFYIGLFEDSQPFCLSTCNRTEHAGLNDDWLDNKTALPVLKRGEP
jgi:hypothetical protein